MENVTRMLKRLDQQSDFLKREQEGGREYCPWSQKQYMERLRSFEWSWGNRPHPCDVIACARHGWHHPQGSSENEIHCVACSQKLYLPWDEGMETEAERIIAQEYYGMVRKDGHGRFCPWRTVPCHLDICKLTVADLARWKEASLKRNDTLLPHLMSNAFTITFPDNLASFINQIQLTGGWRGDLGSWIASLFGWRYSEGLLTCDLGCSEYSVNALDDGNLVNSEFNVYNRHCWYCPLIYEDSWKLIILYKEAESHSTNLTKCFLSSYVSRTLHDLRKANKQ